MTYIPILPNELVNDRSIFSSRNSGCYRCEAALNVDAKQFTMSITFSNVVERALNTLKQQRK